MRFLNKIRRGIKKIFHKVVSKIQTLYWKFKKKVRNVIKNDSLENKKNANYIDTFYYNENTLYFEGNLDTSLSDKELNIIVKLRKEKTFYILPLQRIEKTRWGTSLNLSEETTAFKKGIWDFYIKEIDTKSLYRIRVSNVTLFKKKDTFLYKTEKESRFLAFYITERDGLSFISRTNTFKIDITKIKKEDWDLQCRAKFWPIPNSHVFDERYDEAKISLRQRDTGLWTEFPIQIENDDTTGERSFQLKLNYKEFVPENDINTLRWDAYLSFKIDEEYYRFRIRLQSAEPLSHSKHQFERSELYQIYFYSTKSKYLSLVLSPLTIQRDVFKYDLIKETFHLRGYTFLDTFDFNTDFIQKRNIIIRERISGKEKILPLPDIVFKRKSNQPVDKFFSEHSAFDIKIPLKVLNNLICEKKTIFDLYCQVIHKDRVFERKLGCRRYKYYKDHALATGLVKNKEKFYRHFLTLTPRGNLKIETTSYSEFEYKYIKYGQYSDWIKNFSKDVWLIGERPDTAQDTGYHFFKYCRENYPEKEIYYVIDPNSKDINNIKELGNILYLGSSEHLTKASIAKAFIGSHDLEYFLPVKPFELFSYKKAKRVFLQHGVLGRKNVEYHKKYYKFPFHKFCVSSELEKQMVMDRMGYLSKEVRVTGLSRFDNLLNNSMETRSILLIPTWREWINNEEIFLDSEYFRRYKGLLTNPRLLFLLKKHDVKLKFYPHYRMQQFIEHFGEFNKEYISVIKLGEKSVQQLLLESNIMITDYSSVSSDFNYMSRPIIFYHFDQDRFFANGILRPIEETFLGDICKEEEEVIDSIEYYVERNFTEKEKITRKKYLIFDYIDQKNCERIFNEVTH